MLSKRLTTIANFVDENKVVYDVGTDHALLPCFLVTNRSCPKVYACDNKIGPLQAAKENIEARGLSDKIETVLSDGINDIRDDVNIITIAGMGYFTVMDILKGHDLSKYDKLIIQVNKEMDKLRNWINENHYTILDEEVVEEDKFYEIIVFNAKEGRDLTDVEIEYGPINLKKGSDTFLRYLNYKLEKLGNIYEMSKSPKIIEKIEILNGIIEKIAR